MRTAMCRPRAPSATWTAFGLSLAAHLAAMIGLGPFAVSAPRPGLFASLEVALLAEPAANPAPTAAAEPASHSNSAMREISYPAESGAGEPDAAATAMSPRSEVAGNEPLIESRYDVAALNNPKPPYPLAARRQGIEGRVLLAAHVRADGSCAEVRLKHSSGHGLLDRSALDTVRRWRFLPARRGNAPVDSWVEIPISFRLEG